MPGSRTRGAAVIVLSQGANTALDAAALRVALRWPEHGGELDAAGFLLAATGKVRSDADMVFYNQPSGAEGALRLIAGGPGAAAFDIALAALPPAIDRLAICLSAGGGALSKFNGASLAVTADDGRALAAFQPALGGATETAMIFAEVYRRGGGWKLRAVAQGSDRGLGALARGFGVEIEDGAAPSSPIGAGQIVLDAAAPVARLDARGADFGGITVNFDWAPGNAGEAGFADLEFGCLFELTDGRKGVVQAAGNHFGAVDLPPYVELSGDDRADAAAAGETIRINGRKWAAIARLALFARGHDEAVDWNAIDGVVIVVAPDRPSIGMSIREVAGRHACCGLALIENDGGSMRVTRIMRGSRDPSELDRQLGWGMKWRTVAAT